MSKVLKTEQQNTPDSLRTFCLDHSAFLVYYISCPKLKFEFYTDRSPEKLYMNAKLLKNIQICNQNCVQYASYFQKTIVYCKVKICNELNVASVFHSKSSPLSKYELEQEKPLTVSYIFMHVVSLHRNQH